MEVRPAVEILATLDAQGCLDSLPFMPEMTRHIGQRFLISHRVEKICNTLGEGTARLRMHDTVYLEDLRCDGSAHGGCQAGCRIYWKEAWLRRVDPDAAPPPSPTEASADLEEVVVPGTRTLRVLENETVEVWRCQATEAVKATGPLKIYDFGQYWRDLKGSNYGLGRFLLVAARGLVMEVASRLRLMEKFPLSGEGTYEPCREQLGLQPGQLVQVRETAEIARTLDANGLLRGLSFDREMVPYCGRTLRVKDRVERIIDERTGRMLHISRDCLILEGAVCSGELSPGRWFCPRGIYSFWREAWLHPVEETKPADTNGDLSAKHESPGEMHRNWKVP